MNVIAQLEFELANYNSAVHRFNHYTTDMPSNRTKSNQSNRNSYIKPYNLLEIISIRWEYFKLYKLWACIYATFPSRVRCNTRTNFNLLLEWLSSQDLSIPFFFIIYLRGETDRFMSSQGHYHEVKCKQLRRGFEIRSPQTTPSKSLS